MLKTRILAALVLVPLMVAATLYFPTPAFAVFLGVVVLLGAWEWAALVGYAQPGERLGYALMLLLAMVLLMMMQWQNAERFLWWTAGSGIVWWFFASVWVRRYDARPDNTPLDPTLGGLCGAQTLLPAWAAMVFIHGQIHGGAQLVLLLCVLVWLADSAAYFTGRAFGRHKLAPAVSPGKTWEGVAGGVITSALLAFVVPKALGAPTIEALAFMIVCAVTVAFSVVGDLFESLFKRRAGVKDSGTLIPGHGGVLDRIDSFTAAAPFYVLGVSMLYRSGRLGWIPI